MDLQLVAYISEILASVGLLVSLVFLAIQVRQSNKITKAQSRQVMMSMGITDLSAQRDDPELMSLFNAPDITKPQRLKLAAHLTLIMRQREYEWLELQNESADEKMFEAYSGIIKIVLGTERTRAWWLFNKSMAFNPDFVDFVDNLLKDEPYTEFWDNMDKW
jgi:hypothetical protein